MVGTGLADDLDFAPVHRILNDVVAATTQEVTGAVSRSCFSR